MPRTLTKNYAQLSVDKGKYILPVFDLSFGKFRQRFEFGREILIMADFFKYHFRYRLIPRMLRNVPVRDLSVTVLGERLALPIGAAPSAYQKLAHPEGELAAAAGMN